MNTFAETAYDSLIIARRELALVFRGRKGLLLIAALLAVAALPALVRAIGNTSSNAETYQQAQIAAMMRFFPRDVVRYLIDCPQPLTVGIIATLFFQPAYVLLVGVEMIAGDIDSGAIRFWAGRGSRSGLVLGKALGLWGTTCALTLLVHALIWATSAMGPAGDLAGVWRWGPRLYLLSCAAAMVPVAFVTLLGVSASHPRWVTATGIVALIATRIGRTMLANRKVSVATWLPGALDDRLLSPFAGTVGGGLALVLAWSALFMGAALVVFRRRSL